MKKLLAALAAILCLAGCSAKNESADMIGVSVVTKQETPVVEEVPAVEEIPVEETEPEAEIVEEEPQQELTEESAEGAIDTFAYAEILVEGLVDDAIGYSIIQPEFAGFPAADTVNAFYEKLIQQLETYTKETVHTECLDRHCMANAFGSVLSADLTADCLGIAVEYEFKVEFSDGETKTSVRTDTFHVQTGEQIESAP